MSREDRKSSTDSCVPMPATRDGRRWSHRWEWSVGITTAPRRVPTLERTLASLKAAGWGDIAVFAEPGVSLPAGAIDCRLTRRGQRLGAFPNWYLALAELYMQAPRSGAYLICQDDVLLAEGLRAYMEGVLWPGPVVGVVSVYCPSHVGRGKSHGFHAHDGGWNTAGALAYLFPNPSVRAFLSDPMVVNHRHHGPASGMRNIDSLVGAWCRQSRRPYFVHVPSLAQHIGSTTTVWSHNGCDQRRRACPFARSAALDASGAAVFDLQ